MISNLIQRHTVWSYEPDQNLGEIDHNFHYHVFDDVTCKPPILSSKGQGFTFQELFRSPFTELAFEFDWKKEFMLKSFVQIHQTLKTS